MARGSASPFVIVLTAEEQRELESRVRAYTAPYAQVVRAKIVLLAAEGMANVEIAARLDTSPQVVHRWRKRFWERRLKGLEDAAQKRKAPGLSPLGERGDQSVGVRAAGHHRRAAVALELAPSWPGN